MAGDIEVREFREILFWPLVLTHPEVDQGDWKYTRDLVNQIDNIPGWTKQELRQHLPHRSQRIDHTPDEIPPRAQLCYEEEVYFHSFVRRFLYGEQANGAKNEPVRLFQRADIKTLTARFIVGKAGKPGFLDFSVTLDVERLNLYVFEAGVAMLVLQVGTSTAPMVKQEKMAERPMTLADAQIVMDHLRRVLVPYWNEGTAGRVPAEFRWGNGGPLLNPPGAGKASELLEALQRSDPILPWWREILPLALHGAPHGGGAQPPVTWRPIVDERMPMMAFLVVDDPNKIAFSDWERLCFADEPGPSHPHADQFMTIAEFERLHCYDRFRHWGTRFLCSGYNFVAVGNARSKKIENDTGKREYGTFQQAIGHHFERHYYQMGLVCHFQNAALLAFSEWLSKAVSCCAASQDKLRDIVHKIERERLRFTHMYWFTGLSNHVQARELYTLWRRCLGTETLYAEVAEEARAASQFLDFEEQQEQARAANEQTRAANFLATVATVAAAFGLAMAFLGMNVVFTDLKLDRDVFLKFDHWSVVAAALGASCGLVWLVLWKASVPGAGSSATAPNPLSSLRQWMGWSSLGMAVAAAVLFAASIAF